MMICRATLDDVPDWLDLRAQLWPGTSAREHRAEATALLARGTGDAVALLGQVDRGPWGFAELTLRRDHVPGCDSTPVAFLEGIYIRPDHRGEGRGTALIRHGMGWARARGVTELASDALLDNMASHRFHRTVGFEETERVVFFRRSL